MLRELMVVLANVRLIADLGSCISRMRIFNRNVASMLQQGLDQLLTSDVNGDPLEEGANDDQPSNPNKATKEKEKEKEKDATTS
jgi:hypothetical protein